MKFGVYRIRHLDSNRCYIGSSATGLASRWSQHRSALKKQTHDSPYVQNAWNKYGAHAFVFEVLLYCDPENCLMYEQIALDHYQPVYNIRKVAASNMGIIPSQQTRDRISQTLKTTYARDGHPLCGRPASQESIERLRQANLGKSQTIDHKTNISIALTGRTFSEIHKSRLADSKRGPRNPAVKLTNQDVSVIRYMIFNGHKQKNIARRFGICQQTVSDIKLEKIRI